MLQVALLDLVIDVYIVLMQNLWVLKWLKKWLLQGVWEEWVLVWRFKATDQRLELLLFSEGPVKEGEVAVWDLDGAWGVDGLIKRELDALD